MWNEGRLGIDGKRVKQRSQGQLSPALVCPESTGPAELNCPEDIWPRSPLAGRQTAGPPRETNWPALPEKEKEIQYRLFCLCWFRCLSAMLICLYFGVKNHFYSCSAAHSLTACPIRNNVEKQRKRNKQFNDERHNKSHWIVIAITILLKEGQQICQNTCPKVARYMLQSRFVM